MADKTYHVVQSDVEGMKKKIHRHRRRILLLGALAAALIIAAICGIYIYFQNKSYTQYEVIRSIERQDSAGTRFEEFAGDILKYGKDGAASLNKEGEVIWNQTYEMQEPMVDICGDYLAVAEKKGKEIYIMDTKGQCGKIDTNMPIQRIQIAEQGTVAVLMEQDGTGYLQLYDKEGTFLAEGEVHTEKSGYPLDISLSEDGRKMAVSLLNINDGNVKTTITFYNFGSVGQNEIDNIVGSYSYADMVFPKVVFLTNDIMAAFGNGKAILFEGTQKPQVKKEISMEKEARSIFYNEAYFGLVFENENSDNPYQMKIYDLRGAEVLSQEFNMQYSGIEFLSNDEICIRNDLECSIYSLRGVQKFHSNFEKNIWKIISEGRGNEYIFLMEGSTEKVRLK